MMTTKGADFRPTPLHLRVGHEAIEVASLDSAIHLIRSLRHDRLGHFAEMLLAQLEAAKDPHQKAEAWVAFRTWVAACGLHSSSRDVQQAA